MAASTIPMPPVVIPAARQTMPAPPALPPAVIIPDASPAIPPAARSSSHSTDEEPGI
jgi:hypothetical protein